ncbi:MAG: N-acetylmuramoyl-L-alanine amidase [Lentisphaeria bacterium]|nr:N-acetylmuramoyl-L-alanine amidase [Lentisphaeria bacterium]
MKYLKFFQTLLLLLACVTLSGAKATVILKGKVYRHAGSVSRELKCGYYVSGKNYYIARGRENFSFRPERADFRVSNISVAGSFPARQIGGHLYLSAIDVNTLLRPLFMPRQSIRRHAVRRIIIDPGHGGFDRGAAGKSIIEKKLVLQIAKRTADILKRCGYTCILTRRGDYLVPLNQRPLFANRSKGDLFISLHCNASKDTRAAGIETYCLTPAGASSTNHQKVSGTAFPGNAFNANNFLLAYEIQRSMLLRTKGQDRGVRRSRFAVLRNLAMPGVLLEMGFITNAAEERKLATPAYQEQIARAIAVGIISYHRRIYSCR